jgi:RNA polymerase sigma-70 factor, ECF subfamily
VQRDGDAVTSIPRPSGLAAASTSIGADAAPADRAAAEAVFVAAVGPHYPALVRRLVLVLGNLPDAEDVAQDAYLRALEGWSRFDGVDPRAWLYTIGLRLAFNQLRTRKRRLAAIARMAPPRWEDGVDPDLVAALATLEPRARAAIVLSSIDGYTHAEIGRLLDVPEGTVASWISRSRSQLRHHLSPSEERG